MMMITTMIMTSLRPSGQRSRHQDPRVLTYLRPSGQRARHQDPRVLRAAQVGRPAREANQAAVQVEVVELRGYEQLSQGVNRRRDVAEI